MGPEGRAGVQDVLVGGVGGGGGWGGGTKSILFQYFMHEMK